MASHKKVPNQKNKLQLRRANPLNLPYIWSINKMYVSKYVIMQIHL